MLQNFDEEKAQMRAKFNEQKAEMQAKFDKDIAGLKARLTREKDELQRQVDDSLAKIEESGNLAEAALKLGGILEAAQKGADLYIKSLQEKAKLEYEEFRKELIQARQQMTGQPGEIAASEDVAPEAEQEEKTVKTGAKSTKTTAAKKTTTRKTATKTTKTATKSKTTRTRKKKEETEQADE